MTAPIPVQISASAVRRKGVYAVVVLLLLAANMRPGIAVAGPLAGIIPEAVGGAFASALLIMIPVGCFAAFSPFVPLLSRRWGIDRLMMGALTAIALGLAARVVDAPIALWGGTTLAGIGIAVLNVTIPALIKRDFPTRIGATTGTYLAFQGAVAAGAASTAVPLASVSELAWRLPVSIWAVYAILGLIALAPMLFRSGAETGAIVTAPHTRWSPWSSARGWQIAVFSGMGSTLYFTVLAAWPSVEASLGVDPVAAGLHQGWMQLFNVVGILSTAVLLRWTPSDQRVLIGLLILPLVGIAIILMQPSLVLLGDALVGYAMGSTLAHATALFGIRTSNPAEATEMSAMAQSVGYAFAAVGAGIAGLLLTLPELSLIHI